MIKKSEFLSRTTTLFFIFAFVFIFFQPNNSWGQTIDATVDLTGVVSTSDTTPFWLQSNRNGIYAPDGIHFFTRLQADGSDDIWGPVKISYGADLIARPGSASTLHFNRGYLRLHTSKLYLAAGKFNHSSPDYSQELGMGSLGISGNATPVPQVQAGISDWLSLPYTRNFIQIKGHVAHGWLGSNRYTDNVLYHEKLAFARLGGTLPINLYGGIHHFVKWGGDNHPRHGDLPSSFSDFGRVFIAVGGDDDAPTGEADYMLGDHLGMWEFGFFLEYDQLKTQVYRQFPLETKDNLKLKSPQDALQGVHFTLSEESTFPIRELVYEYLYTKWQDGPRVENTIDGIPCSELPPGTCRDQGQGNENYYNHSIYRTGWVHQRRTLGNPLFTPRSDNLGVSNNRIVAHHIGFLSELNHINIRTKATYSRNYGTRSNPFESPRNQWSFSSEVETPVSLEPFPPFMLTTGIAYDHGSLVGNQFGMMLGLQFSL